jgi:Dolichyl-phosphate-mannose-protein mannosyltransferase
LNIQRLRNNSTSIFFLILLTVIVSVITYRCFQIQMSIGPVWDTYDFLANAALMADKNIGYYDLIRPPFLSFLTSLYFRIDSLATWPIFAIDGMFYILGCISLYLLLKIRLDPLTSFLGTLLFATFPIVLTYVCAAFTDVSSVGISILAILLMVLAVKKDSRFFYLSFPVTMLAFLTRFTMGLLIFPIFLLILINWAQIKGKKNILIGILLSLIVLTPVLLFYGQFGSPIYPFLSFFGSSSGATAAGGMHFEYNPNFFYYTKLMPYLIGPEGVGVIFVILLGLFVYLFRSLKIKTFHLASSWNLLMEGKGKIKLITIIILTIIFLLTIEKVPYLLTEVLFFIWSYLLYDLLKIFRFEALDLDILFLSWFMTFFLFQSIYIIKDYRYFVSMAPSVAYFLMRGFNLTTTQLGLKIRNQNITQIVFAVFLTLLIIFSTFSSFTGMEKENIQLKLMKEEVVSISDWFKNYDPDYKNKMVYSDFWPYSSWYLQMNVSQMPIFRNGMVLYNGAKDYNFTAQDNAAYNNELDSHHADYYFSMRRGLNFTNYRLIKQVGLLKLYQRVG